MGLLPLIRILAIGIFLPTIWQAHLKMPPPSINLSVHGMFRMLLILMNFFMGPVLLINLWMTGISPQGEICNPSSKMPRLLTNPLATGKFPRLLTLRICLTSHFLYQDISDWNVSAGSDFSNAFLPATPFPTRTKRRFTTRLRIIRIGRPIGRAMSSTLNDLFQTVNLCSRQANATATYGHISDWNVSAVTNMSNALGSDQF